MPNNVVHVLGPFTETKMTKVVRKVSERGRGRDQNLSPTARRAGLNYAVIPGHNSHRSPISIIHIAPGTTIQTAK